MFDGDDPQDKQVNAANVVRFVAEPDVEGDYERTSCQRICDAFSHPLWKGAEEKLWPSIYFADSYWEGNGDKKKAFENNDYLCLSKEMSESDACVAPEEDDTCQAFSYYKTTDSRRWCMLHFGKSPPSGVILDAKPLSIIRNKKKKTFGKATPTEQEVEIENDMPLTCWALVER